MMVVGSSTVLPLQLEMHSGGHEVDPSAHGIYHPLKKKKK
jgi:hypothetical protein